MVIRGIPGSEVSVRWRPLFAVVIVAAAAAYSVGLSHESFWYDESYSYVISGYPFWRIPAQIRVDNHPPLYYILLSLVRAVLGKSEWALRSLSAAGAVGLVALGPGPVRRLFGNRGALLYMIVILFTPAILIYAHEARMYSLAIFAVTAGALYGFSAVTENRVRDWIWFGAATLAAAYLHYYGLLAAFFLHAIVFIRLLTKRRELLKRHLIVGAAVFSAYLPWLIVFLRQTMRAQKAFWLGPLSAEAVFTAFIQPFAYREQFPTMTFSRFLSGLPAVQYAAFSLAVALCIWGLVVGRRKGAGRVADFGRFALLAYLGVTAATLAVSLFLIPLFFSRYLLVISGLFLLLVSLGMGMLPGRYPPWIAAALFAALNVFTIKGVYTEHFNHPMRRLAETLDGEILPGDLVITSDSYSLGPAFYYWPEAVHYHRNNQYESRWGEVLNPFVPPLHYEENLEELLAVHDSFWYITCNTGASLPVSEVLQWSPEWEWAGRRVMVMEKHCPVMFTAQEYVRRE